MGGWGHDGGRGPQLSHPEPVKAASAATALTPDDPKNHGTD
jgi:hypothetical protein